jgi:type II restriction enzyme
MLGGKGINRGSIMEDTKRKLRLAQLSQHLGALSESQIGLIESIVKQFGVKREFTLLIPELFTQGMVNDFGDALLIHHCFSNEPFSKDKFEYLLERVCTLNGKDAHTARKGNPGHDITIEGTNVSLKTQAEATIKANEIHISKFMELGHGEWTDKPEQLVGLRDQFFHHMRSYERIFTLRTLSKPPSHWFYELVEIPKELLMEAKNGELRMMMDSKQSVKPGYCDIYDGIGKIKFQLYFDGGGERKLQITHINMDLCYIHATWKFPPVDLYSK